MKAITIQQKMMAAQEYGVKLSTRCTERDAIKRLKKVSEPFANETVWHNKFKR